MSGINFWEPEEAIGTLWHRFVEKLDETPRFPEAAVTLETMRTRLSVFFHGLGGDKGVEIVQAVKSESGHRLSWRRRLGRAKEREERPSYDGERLSLPQSVDAFPEKDLNEALFLWVAAWTAFAGEAPELPPGKLRADIATLRYSLEVTRRTLDACPGLRPIYGRLCKSLRETRPRWKLPPEEAAMETVVRHLIGEQACVEDEAVARLLAAVSNDDIDLADLKPVSGYRPFRPIVLWPDHRRLATSGRRQREDADPASNKASEEKEQSQKKRFRAKRQKSDEANRRDSIILHRFESIRSWAEFLNINRTIDDEEPDQARKVADDQDEIGLVETKKRPATRLAFDLDLAPEDVDRERLAGEHLYPEWDYRSSSYLPEQCRVLATEADKVEAVPSFLSAPETRKRIRAVKRRFEAFRPKRIQFHRQPDGNELDMEALVRSYVDIAATGQGSDRIYTTTRTEARDLAVLTLVDTSRSTESVVEGRPVIDIAREALIALCHGLDAVGDDHAVYAFSSLRRDRVYLSRCKRFDEKTGPGVEARIAALKPGFYTRLGTAIRHASSELSKRPSQHRLLLVLTDGKPNDLDHYEGRYGIEDTRRAVLEARRLGHSVFAITIDKRARDYVPHVFGRNGYAIVSHPAKLTEALPLLYRQLVQ
ncbi:MAG: nitric oxide reductase D protein [Hyphomicrobiales bacterium]|nr:MAG: nitric oxide reductase D protein [Hyphomicrobiales bacterium]